MYDSPFIYSIYFDTCDSSCIKKVYSIHFYACGSTLFLDFCEFLKTISVVLRGTEVQKIMWVFHLFDENDDGTIEVEEIEHVLEECDKKLQEGEVSKLFGEMDSNSDGKLDINEFTAGCRRNDLLLKNVGIM